MNPSKLTRRFSWQALCLLLAVIILAACSGGDSSVEDAVIAAINENFATYRAEDFDGYMGTIHTESPLYTQTGTALAQIFELFDLETTVDKLDFVEVTDEEARVAFEMTTRKVSGPDFADNKITGVFILRQEDGKWKIFNQEIENIEYLD